MHVQGLAVGAERRQPGLCANLLQEVDEVEDQPGLVMTGEGVLDDDHRGPALGHI